MPWIDITLGWRQQPETARRSRQHSFAQMMLWTDFCQGDELRDHYLCGWWTRIIMRDALWFGKASIETNWTCSYLTLVSALCNPGRPCPNSSCRCLRLSWSIEYELLILCRSEPKLSLIRNLTKPKFPARLSWSMWRLSWSLWRLSWRPWGKQQMQIWVI